ncbi:hypothetical protein CC78DRAFT_373240 [Lojkania enalia]|uniref:C3H1-type domain-containing protein n=1 Tax=Lojkania enalia TaxID=147567 RepID=A0A9P4N972_9PLEO|nr:hypothetical protein CC78DRAFT_373240 [Didymosphaeria enalia]
MATFAASGQAAPELADSPHHEIPPPQHLQHNHNNGPFSHQLGAANPPFAALSASNPPRIGHRSSTDLRHASANGAMASANGNGPMPVPGGPHARMGNGHAANMRGMGFDGPRSPPNNKSTSHVPCKFYRQGACQAGKACPFLHSDEPLAERAPCKYFTKGNCKFGPKCALAHILPNGHIVNRNNLAGGPGAFNLGSRVNLPHPPEPAPGSSLLTMQAHMQPPANYNYPLQDEYFGKQQYDMIPTIDTTFTSLPGSNYGSPPNEGGRLPISPVQKGLSVMDVQLPASFDSNGISHVARYGPIASSMPAGFGANSPPSSFQGDSPALRNLRDSAFGDDSRNRAAALGSSPPDSIEQPLGRRIMHSEMRAAGRKGMLSASVGARPPMAVHDDWDETDLVGRFEEELIPSSLNDLLTPQEKMRRFSRDHGENDGSLSHKHSLSRLGASPTTSDLKMGSPSAATSSPSRFQSLWGKSRQSNETGAESGLGTSPFGHIGSPLRNSSLHPGASPSLRAVSRPTASEANPFVSSPPRQASMSMISQQLQRTRLSSRASENAEAAGLTSNPIHPGVTRVTSASSMGGSSGRLGIDRAVSNSSIGRERIEEEQGLFSMEEEDELDRGKGKDGASTTSSTSNKRLSGLSWGSAGKASPSIAPIGGHRPNNSSGLGRDSGPWANPS